MSNSKLTQQIKKQAEVVALKAPRSDEEIPHFLKFAWSFIIKVWKKADKLKGWQMAIRFQRS